MTLQEAVEFATAELNSISKSAKLDAQLLICHSCKIELTKLYSSPQQSLSEKQLSTFKSNVSRRSKGEPLAYITGEKEFWSLNFMVNKHVLIPRPETELLVELALEQITEIQQPNVLDLGTGSGAIAISIASHCKNCLITATDISLDAIQVATFNANKHGVKIKYIHSDWYKNLAEKKFNLIVSNPPYIDKNDVNLEKFVQEFEPEQALISEKNGLKDLEEIIINAYKYLSKPGYLLLEHGFKQKNEVQQLLVNNHFSKIKTFADLSGLERVTTACLDHTRSIN